MRGNLLLRYVARLLVLVFLLGSQHTLAQDSLHSAVASEDILAGFEQSLEDAKPEAASSTASARSVSKNEIGDAVEPFSAKSLTTYNDFSMRHNARLFSWQYYSGIAIFIIVVAIVLMGLLLSYRQFKLQEWKAMHPDKTITATKEEGAMDITTTTLEVGKEGIKINSAVIGLIILTISLVFFFLYLKYVYPIEGISAIDGR